MKDPQLGLAVARIYSPDSPGKTLDYWRSGYRNFEQDKQYALQSLTPPSGGGLGRSTEHYINWNNPANPQDQAKANEERKVAIQELKSYEDMLKKMGLDPWDVPVYQEYTKKLGVTKEGVAASGQTSEETAINDAVEQMKKTGGSYNPMSTVSADLEAKVAKAYNESLKQDAAGGGQAGGGTPPDSSSTPGASGGASGTGEEAKAPQTTPDEMRSKLVAMGIDVSGLSDDQVGTLFSMNQVILSNADKNKSLVPASLSPQDMAKFLQDAHTEIDPYYSELLKKGEKDVMDTVADLTGDYAYREQQRMMQQDKEREQLANQMAETGLTFSGIRNKASEELQQQQTGIVRSEASQLARSLRDQAKQYETTYGSAALANLKIPALSYAGVAVPKPTGYEIGNMLGSNVKSQITDVDTRQKQLAEDELKKRNAMSGVTTPYPVQLA